MSPLSTPLLVPLFLHSITWQKKFCMNLGIFQSQVNLIKCSDLPSIFENTCTLASLCHKKTRVLLRKLQFYQRAYVLQIISCANPALLTRVMRQEIFNFSFFFYVGISEMSTPSSLSLVCSLIFQNTHIKTPYGLGAKSNLYFQDAGFLSSCPSCFSPYFLLI